jgi:CIC family chloride channel protein
VFIVPAYPAVSLQLLPVFAVLGVATGVLGVAFNRGLVFSLDAFRKIPPKFALIGAGVVGAIVGGIAYVSPGVVSGGHRLAEMAMANKLALTVLPGLFLLRFVLTMGSYGCGEAGGIFAPLLALGAIVGGCVGQVAHLIWPAAGIQPGVFAVVGMAAYFTAIVRAPLTGIVLIIEMTASYEQMLPLLIACFSAYLVAEAMGDVPIYEALLQRDLLAGGNEIPLDETIVLELEVQPDGPFAGRAVRELGLPQGVVLVSCREHDREWVPNAGTVLEPHVRVTALISPESEGGLEAFRAGCG